VETKGGADRATVRAVEDAATALGYLIATGERWTDAFHVARRARRMTLPAEIQWSLLPLATFASDDIELSGALEPAYDVGGDAFDYACGSDVATIGLFDAMGHGLASARLSSLAIAAFRNARRRGDDLAAQARFLHEEVAARFETEGFVTGLLVEIPLGSPERSRIVRAGHPPPIVHRDDRAWPLDPSDGRGVPFGMPYGERPTPGSLELNPGDRLVVYSDGVVDARPDGGTHLGIAALSEHQRRVRSLPPREATRRIVKAVRDHRDADLLDDATVLIVDLPR
jgi:serine phosphatase RsbU (regulator of sigma subunit)